VEITLIVGGLSHRVKLLAPDYLLLETAGNHPPAEGELILEIDGNPKHRRVFLPKGLPEGEREVPVRHKLPA
jgi:hypothetical protein